MKLNMIIEVDTDLWQRASNNKKYLEPLAMEIQHSATAEAFRMLREGTPEYKKNESGIFLNTSTATILAQAAALGGVLAWREKRMAQIKKKETT